MLPSQSRLPSIEFSKIKKEGKIFYGKDISILVLGQSGNPLSRFGMIVSTKVSKKAVVRNKIRRYIKRAINDNLLNLRGCDVLVLARSSVCALTFEEVEAELKRVVEKAGLAKTN